jgi:hypothetical protein
MNEKNLFFLVCLPIRILLIIFVKYIPEKYLPYFSWIFLLISINFLVVYNNRMKGIFHKYSWWNELRPIHSCLYLLTFIYTYHKNPYSWIPLTVDVILGFTSFIFHYYL